MTDKEHVRGVCGTCKHIIYGTRISVRAHRLNCLVQLAKKGGS